MGAAAAKEGDAGGVEEGPVGFGAELCPGVRAQCDGERGGCGGVGGGVLVGIFVGGGHRAVGYLVAYGDVVAAVGHHGVGGGPASASVNGIDPLDVYSRDFHVGHERGHFHGFLGGEGIVGVHLVNGVGGERCVDFAGAAGGAYLFPSLAESHAGREHRHVEAHAVAFNVVLCVKAPYGGVVYHNHGVVGDEVDFGIACELACVYGEVQAREPVASEKGGIVVPFHAVERHCRQAGVAESVDSYILGGFLEIYLLEVAAVHEASLRYARDGRRPVHLPESRAGELVSAAVEFLNRAEEK